MQKRAESKKKKQTSQEKLEQLDRQEAALKEKLEVLNKNKSEAFTKFREVSERHSIFLSVYLPPVHFSAAAMRNYAENRCSTHGWWLRTFRYSYLSSKTACLASPPPLSALSRFGLVLHGHVRSCPFLHVLWYMFDLTCRCLLLRMRTRRSGNAWMPKLLWQQQQRGRAHLRRLAAVVLQSAAVAVVVAWGE